MFKYLCMAKYEQQELRTVTVSTRSNVVLYYYLSSFSVCSILAFCSHSLNECMGHSHMGRHKKSYVSNLQKNGAQIYIYIRVPVCGTNFSVYLFYSWVFRSFLSLSLSLCSLVACVAVLVGIVAIRNMNYALHKTPVNCKHHRVKYHWHRIDGIWFLNICFFLDFWKKEVAF